MESTSTTHKLPPTIPRINLSVNEFCSAYGIGRTLVYEEIKRGELKIIKVGKRTLISNVEAQAWQCRKQQSN